MNNKPLVNALRSSGNAEIKPSSRSGFVGALADALRGAQTGLNKVQLPYVGGMGDLMLGGAPQLADDISYQGLSALVRGGNAATGGIGTYGLKPETVDLAGVMTGLGGLAKPAVNAAGRAALPVARDFVETVGANSMRNYAGAKKQIGSLNIEPYKPLKYKTNDSNTVIEFEFSDGDYELDIYGQEGDWIEKNVISITGVETPKKYRNQGHATKAIDSFLNDIKEKYPDADIRLSANPLDKTTKLNRLVDFYKKFGFKVEKNSGDYEGVPMIIKGEE